MHNAARGSLAIGGLILVIGIVMFFLGGAAAGFDPSDDNIFEGKSGSFVVPADHLGYGIYVDEGVSCDSFTATITDSNGSTSDEYWGDYFEKDNCDGLGDLENGFVYVGSFNVMADPGTYTMGASSKVYVVDSWAELGEAAAGGILALCGGLPAIVCGICFLLIGGVLGVSLKDKQNVQIVTQQPQGSMGAPMVMGAPMTPSVPVAAAPIATPAADPAAMGYYNNLIAEGHDPATAASHTEQYYPGFQN